MATVYLAQLAGAHGFEKWVAVKLIHPHLAEDRRFVTMFLDEARIASNIQHPNVCSVLDFGEHAGAPYLVMEYLHGETLSAVVRRGWDDGNVPVWLSARVVADAARGLHAAHELRGPDGEPLGIVHRDVSPQNVLVLYEGMAKVMDFGVARAQGRLTVTSTGEMKGKVSYMAPEHLGGQEIDRRADVWALGVMLWEATVGERLFRGEVDGVTALNVMQKPIPLPSDIVPNYPPALESAVMGCLQRDPDQRTPTAAALAEALDQYLYRTGEPSGVSQVAGWMNKTFGERRASRDAMLRAAPPSGDTLPELDLQSGNTIGFRFASDHPTMSEPLVTTEESSGGRRILGLPRGVVAVLAGGALVAAIAGVLVIQNGRAGTETTDPVPFETSPEVNPQPNNPTNGDDTATNVIPNPPVNPPAVVDAGVAEVAQLDAGVQAKVIKVRPGKGRPRPRPGEETGTGPGPGPGPGPTGPDPLDPNGPPGRLNLLAIPAAEAIINGQSLGNTPVTNRTIAPGRYTIILRPLSGGPSKQVPVTIRASETTRLTVSLAGLGD